MDNRIKITRVVKNLIYYLFGKRSFTLEEVNEVTSFLVVLGRLFLDKTWDIVFKILILGYVIFRRARPLKGNVFSFAEPDLRHGIPTFIHLAKSYVPRATFLPLRAIAINRLGKVEGYPPVGLRVRSKVNQQLGIPVPHFLVVDVTYRCNINPPCQGCLAGLFSKEEPSLEDLDRVVSEAAELGTSVVIFSGGEPLMREKDILEILRKHPQIGFRIFTNATMITKETPKRFFEAGAPVAFFLSLEGFRQTTDKRRQPGMFDKVIDAMNILKDAGFPFAFSVTVNRQNLAEVTSTEFLDFLAEQGGLFGIYLPYKPVGINPNPEMILTSNQEMEMKEAIRNLRMQGRLVFGGEDFLVANKIGCTAGKDFISVTAQGEIQPCPFLHLTDFDMKLFGKKRQTFAEVLLKSPLMAACREIQIVPDSCLITSRRNELNQIIEKTKANSTEQRVV